jgi:RNA polymerase sigma-70 factor (ECF subfamily)
VDQDVLDLAEMRRQIDDLSVVDLFRLRKFGKLLALGLDVEADDLIGEAVVSALNGNRKCPRSLRTVSFLMGAMRSIASAIRVTSRRTERAVSLEATGTDGRSVVEIACPDPTAEERALRQEDVNLRAEALEDLFADDEEALLVLWADFEETPKEETIAMNKLDEKAYATIRRRMRRKIDRKFPNGWTA